jgi:hypothetical protein
MRFFLKKEAKVFARLRYTLPQRARHTGKSFLVLFFKKELLSPSLAPCLQANVGMAQLLRTEHERVSGGLPIRSMSAPPRCACVVKSTTRGKRAAVSCGAARRRVDCRYR